jgi:hypothetical protein
MDKKMLGIIIVVIIALTAIAAVVGMQTLNSNPSPTPTPTPSPSPTPEPTIASTATPMPSPTPDMRTQTTVTLNIGQSDNMIEVSGSLSTVNGEPLAWHTLSFSVSISAQAQSGGYGGTYSAKTDANGNYAAPLPVNPSAWSQVTVSFAGDDQLAPSATTKTQ